MPEYRFPFGELVRPLAQEDQTPKRIFVLGVYASAVHARWRSAEGRILCTALAVASEPRIFWNGDPDEAKAIVGRVSVPPALGSLEPADGQFNGPSAKALDENVLAPLGFSRGDAWLCDCLPETRLNSGQQNVIRRHYDPLRERYGLCAVTVPERPRVFCDETRAKEITDELLRSRAELLVLLGDIPIAQYRRRAADVPFSGLRAYAERFGYGTRVPVEIGGRRLEALPLAHPRHIGGLGKHSGFWRDAHRQWEAARRAE